MNMKKVNFLIVLLITISLINGCKKETSESSKPSVKSEEEIDKKFKIGKDNVLVDIIKFDSSISINAPWHSNAIAYLDVDKNGVSDFEIKCNWAISPGGVNVQSSSIKILNPSIYISVIEVSDTSHLCESINYKMYYNNNSNYICCDSCKNTTYPSEIYNYPYIYHIGDTLNHLEKWLNNELTLSYYDHSSHSGYPTLYKFLCDIKRGNWNNQNMKYILFKKEHNDKFLYGWIRISLENYSNIRVYEYALQKEIF